MFFDDANDGPVGESSRRARVLIVDDNATVRESLAATLRGDGHEVATVSCAEDALALMASSPMDVVLSDVDMPGFNGKELAIEVERRAIVTCFGFMTGGVHTTDVLMALSGDHVRVAFVLRKPFTRRELRQGIIAAVSAAKS